MRHLLRIVFEKKEDDTSLLNMVDEHELVEMMRKKMRSNMFPKHSERIVIASSESRGHTPNFCAAPPRRNARAPCIVDRVGCQPAQWLKRLICKAGIVDIIIAHGSGTGPLIFKAVYIFIDFLYAVKMRNLTHLGSRRIYTNKGAHGLLLVRAFRSPGSWVVIGKANRYRVVLTDVSVVLDVTGVRELHLLCKHPPCRGKLPAAVHHVLHPVQPGVYLLAPARGQGQPPKHNWFKLVVGNAV